MAGLQELGKRLDTVGELLSVVRTMKSLAAVNIRQFEEAAHSLDDYAEVMETAWQVFLRHHSLSTGRKQPQAALFLVIGSDQGMCGQFNEQLAEAVEQKLGEMKERSIEVRLWVSGERIERNLEDAVEKTPRRFPLPGSIEIIGDRVFEIIAALGEDVIEPGARSLYLFHNRLKGSSSFRQETLRLLPLDELWTRRFAQRDWPGRNIPQLGAGRAEVFSELLRQYLFTSVYRGFAQSMASENAARLASMQAAEKNIREMREELTSKYREARQMSITEELFDVVAGFTALEEEA